MDLFRHHRVSQHITRIETPFVCTYLVEGTQRAILIDSGFGYGDLRGYVENLTHLPLDVILSHPHSDHGGGSGQFDRVYLNPIDRDLEEAALTTIWRKRLLAEIFAKSGRKVDPRLFHLKRSEPYDKIHPGDFFDLGGVSLQTFAMPGHTEGEVGFLIEEDRIFFAGDAATDNTFIYFDHSAPLSQFKEGLEGVMAVEDKFDQVLVSHKPFVFPKEIIRSNHIWADRVLAGEDDHLYLRTREGTPIYTARNRNKQYNDLESLGNIRYIDKLVR